MKNHEINVVCQSCGFTIWVVKQLNASGCHLFIADLLRVWNTEWVQHESNTPSTSSLLLLFKNTYLYQPKQYAVFYVVWACFYNVHRIRQYFLQIQIEDWKPWTLVLYVLTKYVFIILYIVSLIYITFGVTTYCWSVCCICLSEIRHLHQILQKYIFVDHRHHICKIFFVIKCLFDKSVLWSTSCCTLLNRKPWNQVSTYTQISIYWKVNALLKLKKEIFWFYLMASAELSLAKLIRYGENRLV